LENKHRYPARSTAIAARMMGGEMMIMSPVNSTFFSLNEVASLIWQAADGRTSLAEIVDTRICPAFEVDRKAALQDAEEFVERLSRHGILRVSTEPVEDASDSEVPLA